MNRENGLAITDRLHLTSPVNHKVEVGGRVNGILRCNLQNGHGVVHPDVVRELIIKGFDGSGQVVLVPSDGDGEEVTIDVEEFIYSGGIDDPNAEVYRLVQDFA